MRGSSVQVISCSPSSSGASSRVLPFFRKQYARVVSTREALDRVAPSSRSFWHHYTFTLGYGVSAVRNDIIDRLSIDPGRITLGQLLQDREAALIEIKRLCNLVSNLQNARRNGVSTTEEISKTTKGMDTGSTGKLITISELCDLLRIARSTFYHLRTETGFPRPLKFAGRTVRYPLNEILAWQERVREN